MRWGMVGTGWIAEKFAADLIHDSPSRLQAVASRHIDRAKAFAEEHQIPHAVEGVEALAARNDIDVIYIATPNSCHAREMKVCLSAGKPVLCEKPFTLNADEARDVIAVAQRTGVFCMEAMWTRFLPAIDEALRLVSLGAIGQADRLEADLSFYRAYDAKSRLFDPALGGGSILDLGVYPVSFAHALFGRPAEVRADAVVAPSGVDSSATISLIYPDREATLQCGFTANGTSQARIVGADSQLRIAAPMLRPEWIAIERSHNESLMNRIGNWLTRGRFTNRHLKFPVTGYGLHYQVLEVRNCIQGGLSESPIWPLAKSLDVMETLDAARENAGVA